MKKPIGIVTLIALGAVVGWFAGSTLSGRPVRSAPQPVRPGTATQAAATELAAAADDGVQRAHFEALLLELAERLSAVEDSVSQLGEGVAAARAATDRTPVARPDADSLETLRASIDELRTALESHFAADEVLRSSVLSLASLKEEHAETNWGALEEVMVQWRLDEEAATDMVRLHTPEDVVRRFGAPHEVWRNDRGTNWLYNQGVDPVSGEPDTEVWLCFQDGYVTMLGVKQP